jgi:predicted TIM-barrel fold metal-dependent hydrolase
MTFQSSTGRKEVELRAESQYETNLSIPARRVVWGRIWPVKKFFERGRDRVVEIIGLVCAKSRRAGQFSCFLTGITGGSLFYA